MRVYCNHCTPIAAFESQALLQSHTENVHGETHEIANAFDTYANVFNTAKAALTFVRHHRPGHIVVKVGRKFVPAMPEFAKKMGLKVIKEGK